LGSDFPFEKFAESKTLLWGKYNAERDIASLLFSPSRTLSNLLKVTMQKELIRDAGHTDMSLLSKVAIELDKQHAYLPSLSSKTSKLLNKRSKPSDEEIIQNSELSPCFGGVFDHAVIGMWFDGLDPQHKFGFRENLFSDSVMNRESFVDPIGVEYHLQRPFELAITEEQALTPLYCLHIHSKSTLWFRLDEIEIIKNKVEQANAKERSISLDLKVLIELIVHNFQNGTLIRWARHGLKYLIDLRQKKGKST